MSSKPTLQDAIALATKYREGQFDKGDKYGNSSNSRTTTW